VKRRRIVIPVLSGLVVMIAVLASCIITVEIEGDYVEPDKLQMSMIVDMNGEVMPGIEVIMIGDDIYVKDPETGQWMWGEDVEEYDDYTGLEEFALGSIEYMKAFEGTSILGDEEINGIPCYHVKGIVSPEDMIETAQELIPPESEALNAELWIGKNDYLVYQMVIGIEMEEASEDSDLDFSIPGGSFTFTYRFSRHNEPVDIEAPQLSE
jgi:hypothetical protein